MIKISVIIPVYNSRKFIGQCLDSVMCQTFSEFEVICIDDGSSDGSYSILLEYSLRHKNITVVRQQKKGTSRRETRA